MIGLVLLACVAIIAYSSWPKIKSWLPTKESSAASAPPANVQSGTLQSVDPKPPSPGNQGPAATSDAEKPATLPPPRVIEAATLTGSWRGGRHLTEFRADGTFLLDPDIVPEPAGGRWKLEGRRLTQTYHEGNSIVLDIVSIGGREMTASDPATGQKFSFRREDIARIWLNDLQSGAIKGDELSRLGLSMTSAKGSLAVMDADKSMVMPGGTRRLLIIEGERVTELAFTISPPARAFSITLPGISGGSSFPTFRMTAFDRAGRALDSVVREHWIPGQPRTERLTLSPGSEMTRVVIAVDNRFGDTAWATFNCLPIAEVEIVR